MICTWFEKINAWNEALRHCKSKSPIRNWLCTQCCWTWPHKHRLDFGLGFDVEWGVNSDARTKPKLYTTLIHHYRHRLLFSFLFFSFLFFSSLLFSSLLFSSRTLQLLTGLKACCLWPPYGIGQAIIFSSCFFFFFFFFFLFFPRLISAVACFHKLVQKFSTVVQQSHGDCDAV